MRCIKMHFRRCSKNVLELCLKYEPNWKLGYAVSAIVMKIRKSLPFETYNEDSFSCTVRIWGENDRWRLWGEYDRWAGKFALYIFFNMLNLTSEMRGTVFSLWSLSSIIDRFLHCCVSSRKLHEAQLDEDEGTRFKLRMSVLDNHHKSSFCLA